MLSPKIKHFGSINFGMATPLLMQPCATKQFSPHYSMHTAVEVISRWKVGLWSRNPSNFGWPEPKSFRSWSRRKNLVAQGWSRSPKFELQLHSPDQTFSVASHRSFSKKWKTVASTSPILFFLIGSILHQIVAFFCIQWESCATQTYSSTHKTTDPHQSN